ILCEPREISPGFYLPMTIAAHGTLELRIQFLGDRVVSFKTENVGFKAIEAAIGIPQPFPTRLKASCPRNWTRILHTDGLTYRLSSCSGKPASAKAESRLKSAISSCPPTFLPRNCANAEAGSVPRST